MIEEDRGWGRGLNLVVQILIVLSLVAFSVETLPGIAPEARRWLGRFEFFTVGVFTIEYLLRLSVSQPRTKYLRSFLGIVDLVAILPFWLGMAADLRFLRVLRLLRLVRILKLVRYSRAVQRLHIALKLAWEELVLYLSFTLIVLYLAAVGIYFCENNAQPEVFASVLHSLWWAVATLTTVGYGDAYPVTAAGKGFTFVILLVGLGVVAVPAGLVSSALSKAREIQEEASQAGRLGESFPSAGSKS